MATFNTANNTLQSFNKSLFEMVINNNQSLYSAPFELSVARGLIPGVQALSISGYQSAVSSTWIPLWDGGATTYTYPVSAAQVRIWSSSASDTSIPVTINGLDSSYNLLSEVVTLNNGITGVLSVNNYLRINSITCSVNPVGSISCGNSGKTATYAAILAGNSKSQGTYYTVPNGYTFYLTQVLAFTNQNGQNYSNYRSYTQSPTGLITTVLQFPLTIDYMSRKVVPRPYTQKTDIQWQFTGSSTSQIGAQIEGYLVQGV